MAQAIWVLFKRICINIHYYKQLLTFHFIFLLSIVTQTILSYLAGLWVCIDVPSGSSSWLACRAACRRASYRVRYRFLAPPCSPPKTHNVAVVAIYPVYHVNKELLNIKIEVRLLTIYYLRNTITGEDLKFIYWNPEGQKSTDPTRSGSSSLNAVHCSYLSRSFSRLQLQEKQN